VEVFWTKFALSSLSDIYTYYKNNLSITIADKLLDNIISASAQLETFPNSGTKEDLLDDFNDEYRYIVRGNYKMIYKVSDGKIFITDVFDSRQDPSKIKKRNFNQNLDH
jgi:toxin ParE1/3/4